MSRTAVRSAMNYAGCVLVILTAAQPIFAEANPWRVTSPDGKITAIVAQCDGALCYSVELEGKEVLPPAALGVTMEEANCDFAGDLVPAGQESNSINEIYSMLSGKKNLHHNEANELTLIFKNKAGNVIQVIFRAYNDGVAFRYHFPGDGKRTITGESSAFRMPPGSVGWLLEYKPQYEGYYLKTTAADKPKKGICFPALFQASTGVWVLCTEAAVYGDYCGSRLVGSLAGDGVFRVTAPWKVSGQLPWSTPWRVAIIGSNLGTIVESVLVTNLNPPCEVEDTSWIKPGRSTFPWWSDPCANTSYEKMKKFAGLAAEMGWEWLEFDTGLITDAHPKDYIATDEWMSVPWVPQFVKYCNDKGVSVYGWDHWKNLDTPEKRAKMFGFFNKISIKGVKIDFMDSDSQETFKWYDDTIRDCLKYKLMVSFHGATIPRGQSRRWPHIASWEAVLGAEYYQDWSKTPPLPEHTCTLPFTRNAVGPMDFTGVTFSTDRKKTTNAHELALSVIFESGWQNIADKPEAYAASPGKPFLKEVPAAWDDIHFIDGYPGEFVCLARRKGNDWFVAAINAEKERTIKAPLDFLKPDKYSAKLYCDDEAAKDIAVKEITLDTAQALAIAVPANGGFAVRIADSAGSLRQSHQQAAIEQKISPKTR